MESIQEFISFIKKGTSPGHVVAAAERRLVEAGFMPLSMGEEWSLQAGGKYYVHPYGAVLFAFTVGQEPQGMLRLAASHVDFPCLRIKPSPSICQDGYCKVNVEVYGGMILNTWLDRPLSCAGTVAVRGESTFSPALHLLDCRRPLGTIPNLAIHMNRKINEGLALNKQVDMLPLVGLEADGEKNFFERFLGDELGYAAKDILSWDLTLYPAEEPCLMGLHEELLSSPRLDNLTSVWASLQGLLAGTRQKGINGIALFDHEEVGSRSKQGAAAVLLPQVLERVYAGLGLGRSGFLQAAAEGFFLSMDVAHGLHPNHKEKCDITNMPVLNGGVVLKTAASQSYTGDAEGMAIVRELCRCQHIPCQVFVNRSDIPGGSTLGAVASAVLPMRSMDVGVPLLAMHSARETMGVQDQQAINDLAQAFFSAK